MPEAIDLRTVPAGRLIPLALETIKLYRTLTSSPDGRELLERKKDELRKRGILAPKN